MNNKKTLLVSSLAVAFVSALVFGVLINETWAGYGSASGIAPVGGTMYSVPVLYDTDKWGLMGFYQDTMSGLDIGFDVVAMVWSYSELVHGNQCIAGFALDNVTFKPNYVAVCWNGSEWSSDSADGGRTSDQGIRKFRIINIITNDINSLSDVAQQ